MNYHLSSHTILTTLRALAALQSLACGEEERAILAPILCNERMPLLAVIVRNAFVETVMSLGSLVTDTSMDDAGDDESAEDFRLSVELVTPDGFSDSRHVVVRRALEQTVALTALRLWCAASVTAAGAGASRAAAGLSDRFGTLADSWHATLDNALAPSMQPCIRECF